MGEASTVDDVDLGFVEESEDYLLTNTYFPSKVGGRPAWLDLEHLPHPDELKCASCKQPCIFLCQIYASLDEPETFHRTIYVFMCKNAECCQANKSDNFIVFRNQLPRKNKFYSFEAPQEDDTKAETSHVCQLCIVCGCRGPFQCPKCKNTFYCGPAHQRLDWKSGHREKCGAGKASPLFPEYEIILETEKAVVQHNACAEDEQERAQLAEYEKMVSEGKAGDFKDVPETELLKFAKEEDEAFSHFQKITAQEPEQILRYCRKGSPLWITSTNVPAPDAIPKCSLCGDERVFEFQIMPQLLNYLRDDGLTLDWGVLAIYTCVNSCEVESQYVREHIHKQDIVEQA
ncbi:programmed cell death protein 2 [Phlebotomus argentipes]|uniref:programmed cell death protein 2 n=1 Tax=Phlebotomus argentipes TaxID=94469 RepID=UPI00289347BF|nr:programmed cell death protein 2 [Phlebotomus argentipes]